VGACSCDEYYFLGCCNEVIFLSNASCWDEVIFLGVTYCCSYHGCNEGTIFFDCRDADERGFSCHGGDGETSPLVAAIEEKVHVVGLSQTRFRVFIAKLNVALVLLDVT
jgi:hypothetical protein